MAKKKKAKWEMKAFDDHDKWITIYAGDIMIKIDHDDCDLDESEKIAKFIMSVEDQYNNK